MKTAHRKIIRKASDFLPDPKLAAEYFDSRMRFTLGPAELKSQLDQGLVLNLIDVRGAEAYARGHIPGAMNLPREDWTTFRGLSRDRINIVYCYSPQCHLAPEAALLFAQQGYPVMEMEGGIKAWTESYGYRVEGTEAHPAEGLAQAA